MKVFIAGATGAIGKQLVPMLVERGHEVTGMTRTSAKQDLIRGLGARPVVADALDPEGVARAVAEAEPEVVIHQLTAIDASRFGRSLDKTFALTNRLRTEGTDHLLAAANAAGARRFIAQSVAGWPFERTGGAVACLYLVDHFEDGQALLNWCEKFGLEGVVSKARDSHYTSGPSRQWLKSKCPAWREANRERHKLFEKPR